MVWGSLVSAEPRVLVEKNPRPGRVLALRWCFLSVEWEDEQKSENKRVAKAETLCSSKNSQTVDAVFPQLNAVFP